MEVKGLEMVCFEPRSQAGLALGYATAATGPRYDIAEHDWDFDTSAGWAHSLALAATLGIHERIPMNELSLEKVRRYKVLNTLCRLRTRWGSACSLSLQCGSYRCRRWRPSWGRLLGGRQATTN